jgi:uncharacterized delta-60 repeat protein
MTLHILRRRSRTLVLLGSASMLAIGVSATTLASVPAPPSHAAAPTYFSGDGKQTTDFGDGSDSGMGVVIQPDGKTVVVGVVDEGAQDDIGLARYNKDGTLDGTFASGGTSRQDLGGYDEGNAVALQTDGKILVTGHSDGNLALARYNNNGTLDGSFANGGIAVPPLGGTPAVGHGLVVQPDGKIVVGGTLDSGTGDQYMVVRYTSDGLPDGTFGTAGKQVTDMDGGSGNSVALQSDDKIVLSGSTGSAGFGVVRYTSDGMIDNTFSGDGVQTTELVDGDDEAQAVAIQPAGQIVVAGATTAGGHFKFALARYNTDGLLDNTYSGDGVQTTAFDPYANGYGAAVGSDDKITLAGETIENGMRFALARYNTDGSLDAAPADPPPPTTDPAPKPEPKPTPTSSRACTITGTAHRDVIRGTSGRDVICARGGADLVYGLGGNDLIFGHRGNDRLIGGSGNDRIHGQRGRDRLNGKTGKDILRGGPRRDRLYTRDGVRGNDTARGGAAKDKCITNRRDLRRHC